MVTHRIIPTTDPRTTTTINLHRALSRLQHKILSPSSNEPHSRLQHSHYERVRTSGNLEYARTLLLRLEHDSSALKIQSQKSAAQSSLSAHRALIKRLGDRLQEFEQTGDDSADWQDGEEDLLAKYEDDKPATTTAAADHVKVQQDRAGHNRQQGPSEPQNVIRNRGLLSQPQADITTTDTALTTGASTSPPIPNPNPDPNNSNNDPSLATATLLESASSTQTALTASLVSMAQQLKQSSQAFSASLEADTEHLDRAVEGLDRNTSGMDAAGGRMGLLRRMSEGRGWWGRTMLYAWIGGLWVVAILLVGVAPKLRF